MVDVRVNLITDRGCMSEITRHRVASFNIESTRFVNYKRGVEFILPIEFYDIHDNFKHLTHMNPYVKEVQDFKSHKDYMTGFTWKMAMERAEEYYKQMIAYGAAPQLARSVLPNSLKTNIIMKTNLRDWINIFKLRTSSGAHPQMNALMKDLKEQFKKRIPIIFDV